ncbi:protein translocase subunit SecD [Thorsellia anophelis]|uniref:Protein translocase subunit SecD n=1 Tax=Thorsellia anophelis DSM 18579 TaxID=1123402 RepID=A0A1I0BZN6_9GAMM|nr:protein translocase subunit SecD [Thorsellia anophelis]SET12315.1 preprotein translocase subunit SecD [Thorsellia anophelis DSM 18579]
MLNKYPLWKYILLIVAIIIGGIYALPNIYGEDPAIQIQGTRGANIDLATNDRIRNVLVANNITNAVSDWNREQNSILIRFNNQNEQLAAKDILLNELGKDYIIALNLAPATPFWLRAINAEPMKLGLDLRGGVHFLMEIDTDTVLLKLQDQISDSAKDAIVAKKIEIQKIEKIDGFGIKMQFETETVRNEALASVSNLAQQFTATAVGNNEITFIPSAARIAEAKENALVQNLTILRNRVNQLGVAEPIVQRQGTDRIVVDLPGIQDTARAKEILGATATLEFRLINQNVSSVNIAKGRIPADTEIKYDRNGNPVALFKRAALTGDHINDAKSSVDEKGLPTVSITLDSAGGTIMQKVSQQNLNKPMATLFVEYKEGTEVDERGRPILEKHEEVINTANIAGVFGSQFQISGLDNPAEARQLAILLRAGALIAPIQIIEESTVGPTLGAQNIAQGFKASLWGFISSVIFMLVYYRAFGFIASIALTINLVMIVGVMSMIPGATLTMPGIAGIVLTVAIAVDANVLIYERIKEELKNGRSVQQAIHEGYKGAFSTILDANLTTIITAIILYAVGTGSIKGFAITTTIGVATSMITAIAGTRAIVNLRYGGKRIDKLSI